MRSLFVFNPLVNRVENSAGNSYDTARRFITMKIIYNGKEQDIPAVITLAKLLRNMELNPDTV